MRACEWRARVACALVGVEPKGVCARAPVAVPCRGVPSCRGAVLGLTYYDEIWCLCSGVDGVLRAV